MFLHFLNFQKTPTFQTTLVHPVDLEHQEDP
jgi:hypothetical protein